MPGHREKLRLGMSLDEVKAILGEPATSTSYGEYLEKLAKRGTSVVRIGGNSTNGTRDVDSERFYLFARPEGQYFLVFRGGKLLNIRSAP